VASSGKATDMADMAKLVLNGTTHDLDVVVGTEGEQALDISGLRKTTGHITLDEGYMNTGSCASAITFVDDKVNHLQRAAGLGVRPVLAGWGFNTVREHSLASSLGFEIAHLSTAEATLFKGDQ